MKHICDVPILGTVQFFKDTDRSLFHLRDHVVSAAECYAWALVFEANKTSSFEDIVGGLDFRTRARYIDRLFNDPSDETLYQNYVHSITRGLKEAIQTQWMVTTIQHMAALTTDGMMIFGQRDKTGKWIINTAYIAGMGRAQIHEHHQSGHLKREIPPQLWPDWTHRWTTTSTNVEKQLYRRVFKPAYRQLINRLDGNRCAQNLGQNSSLNACTTELLTTLERRTPTFDQWQEKRNEFI